jgi:hypothetical protein
MSQVLRKKAIVKGQTRYANRVACNNCSYRCTKAVFKTVDFPEGNNTVKSKVFADKKTVVITILNSESQTKPKSKDTITNLTTSYPEKKVRIKFVPDKNKLRLRKCIVEHPFGTIKRWCDASYLLLKGNIKVTAELSLSFLAYNMKRAINMVGVNKLISKMQAM